MKRIVIRERTPIPPFGEPARDLRILNKPLWLLQRDALTHHCRGALEVDSLDEIPKDREELLVHRDNLFFNDLLIDTFIEQAKASVARSDADLQRLVEYPRPEDVPPVEARVKEAEANLADVTKQLELWEEIFTTFPPLKMAG